MGIRRTGQTTLICDQCGKEKKMGQRMVDMPKGWHSVPLSIDDIEHDGPFRLCSFDCLATWAAAQSAAEVVAEAESEEDEPADDDVSDDEGVEA